MEGIYSEFDKTLATLEREMALVQNSTVLGIVFQDGRNLVTISEEDPLLREVLVEYYRSRIERMHRWQSEGHKPDATIWHLASSECSNPLGFGLK